MSMLPVGFGASGDYTIEESLRFNASQSSYLSWTPASAGNRKTWTWSGWVKRGDLGTGYIDFFSSGLASPNPRAEFGFNNNNLLLGVNPTGSSGFYSRTNAVFRDPSAWYHVVFYYDMTQATSTDRLKCWVNGELQTFSTYSVPAQNTDLPVNNTVQHGLGVYIPSIDSYFDGYLTEVNFIDGQALDPSSFGETDATTGVWKPKGYTGTYGTNGFYLPMKLDNTTEGFNTVTWVGNGSTQQITGVGFSPDLVWSKQRSGTEDHNLVDSVRGFDKNLRSNQTGAEFTQSVLTSLDTDGFSVSSNGRVNTSGSSYVAWCWDAGNTTVSNTDGSITSSVRANPTYGFSVVNHTGTGSAGTVGHGLGVKPSVIIVKARDSIGEWFVYTTTTGAANKLNLHDTVGSTATTVWTNTEPTSSVFSINAFTGNVIAYCFSEVSGYSKFGSYTGNYSTSGPIITTGFKPAMVMIKRTDSTADWLIIDNTRSPTNYADDYLSANSSAAEQSNIGAGNSITWLADGFQITGNWTEINDNGGTYIYMAFKDTREYAFWLDDSGNNNDWQPNGGITTQSTVTDTPTPYLGGGNYAVLNPLDKDASFVLGDGNLNGSIGAASWVKARATFAMPTGKWYWEFTPTSASSQSVGIIRASDALTGAIGAGSFEYGYWQAGYIYAEAGVTAVASYTTGDVIGITFDAATGQVTFYKNNVLQGSDIVASSETYFPALSVNAGSGVMNFGQRPFAYTPPTGFLPLHTGNLPNSSIVDGSKYFDALLYTGNGTTQSITGLEFQPDFTWIKSRSNASWNSLDDAVRGAGKTIFSNTTDPEYTYTNAVTSFNSDGFSLGADTEGGSVNVNTRTYVAWNWKASGTGVTNTDGSITSTVSANPTAGFSIVSYTQSASTASVGHGLGVAPKMIIVKNRTGTGTAWYVYHSQSGAGAFLTLNSTSATTANTSIWNNTSPTSSVFNWGPIWSSGDSVIAYCFAEVESYSKFGSYLGNGSSDGPFVYTGFRPAFVMIKPTSTTGSWQILDTSRDLYNVEGNLLWANESTAETSSPPRWDGLSNGFKVRAGSATHPNVSGATYIYMAFAENPFKNSLAR